MALDGRLLFFRRNCGGVKKARRGLAFRTGWRSEPSIGVGELQTLS
jgi:hypothetical protein